MDDLIEALMIFRKYGNPSYPTHCEHDTLTICISPQDVDNEEDIAYLEELGFHIDDNEECFYSFRFGSA